MNSFVRNTDENVVWQRWPNWGSKVDCLNKVDSNIYKAITSGIIALYRVISILMQFLAGRKVPLTGDSDNLNVWFIQA